MLSGGDFSFLLLCRGQLAVVIMKASASSKCPCVSSESPVIVELLGESTAINFEVVTTSRYVIVLHTLTHQVKSARASSHLIQTDHARHTDLTLGEVERCNVLKRSTNLFRVGPLLCH